MNFWTNLFGGTTARVEKEAGSFFYMMRGNSTDFPFKSLFEIYKGIPHLRAVIDKKAELFSNVKFKIVKTNTSEEEIDIKHPLNEVLKNPNVFQSWRQMLYMLQIYKSVAGVAFIYPGFGLSRSAKRLDFLKNIDFADYIIKENRLNNTIQSQNISEIIDKITFTLDDGKVLNYLPEDLIMFKDSFSSYIKNHSKITTLKTPIENIYKALVARGILIDKKGGVGILSGNQKDGGVAVPMKPSEKEALNSRLNGYGLGAGKEPVIITDANLNWQSMVFPTNQLMLFEEIEDDFFTICDSYGVARETFNGNATFANKEQADAMTYNTIMSEWTDLFDLLNDNLFTAKEGIKIVQVTDHIGALAEDELQNIQTQAAKSAMLISEVSSGLISIQEYRQQMGYVNTLPQ